MTTSTTLAAWHSLSAVVLTTIEERVLAVIESYGEDGCTYEQILPHFSDDTREGTSTGRIKPLIKKGLIFRNGETRPGKTSGRQQLVNRHIKFAASAPVITPPPKKKNPYEKGRIDATKKLATSFLSCSDLREAKLKFKEIAMRMLAE